MADFGQMTWAENLTATLMGKRLKDVNLNPKVLDVVELVSDEVNNIF